MRITWLAIPALLALSACGKNGETDDTNDTDSPTDTDVVVDECDGGVCILSGTILEDMTLDADHQWLLRGGVFIGDDTNETVLTIEPGTVIYGETSTAGMLVVRRGSRIEAEGTVDAPIRFTSSKAEGSRARGDWGGLILNGRAPINRCADPESETCEAFGEGGTGYYGGNDAHDDSGSLAYVVVEFAGIPISPENELNGIGFQGVGDGTSVDHVQVHMGGDDGIEFFGGTVNVKHVLVTGMTDDMFDWTDGWQGKAQFLVGQQWADNGDNGIEADNNNPDNDAEPRSNPTISNITLIGSPDSTYSDDGMLLREGTDAHITNAVVTGFNEACIDVDGPITFARADNGTLVVDHTVVDCALPFLEDEEDSSVESWFTAGAGNEVADVKMDAAFSESNPDYAPANDSPALTGAVVPADSFFEQVDFRGGVDPANDWTVGWTTHVAN